MNTTPAIHLDLEPKRHYRWELLGLLCAAFFLHQGDRAIFGVVLTSIRAELGLTDSEMGMVGFALFVTLALLMPVAGYAGDVFSRKWIITAAIVFWSAATMITGLTQGVVSLILFRSVATAGGESFYAPAAYPLMATYHQKTRALAMSIHQAALYLGVITSGWLAGRIAECWGWRSAFYVFGAAGIGWGLVLAIRLKDAPAASGPTPAAYRPGVWEALGVLLRCPTAVLLTAGFTAIVSVNNAFMVWAPAFVEEKFGLSVQDAGGYSLSYHHVTALIAVLVGGRLSDLIVIRRRKFRLELQATAMLLGVPAIAWMGLAGSLNATWAAMALMGLCRGLYESNTHAALFDVIAPRYRASAVGVMTMIGFLIGSLGPLFLGVCRQWLAPGHGLSYGFASLATLYLVGGLAVLAALRLTFQRDYVAETPSA